MIRTAYKRCYDMVMSYGREEYIDNKKKLVRYHFFQDPDNGGKDAVYGLDIPIMRLVAVLKSAAEEYGAEKRIILLHGPVGSAKSTLARQLKRGLERYSRTDDGRMFTFEWTLPEPLRHLSGGDPTFPSPMHEEPLKLIPAEWRAKAFAEMGIADNVFSSRIKGDLDPASRYIFRELMAHYGGDWTKVMQHVRVKRLL